MPAIAPPTTPTITNPMNALTHTGCLLKLASAASPIGSVLSTPLLSSFIGSFVNGGVLDKVPRGLHADLITAFVFVLI
jgi:hypothetical protein